jgi:glycosyltransferase involved in cell wall biosynthesis
LLVHHHGQLGSGAARPYIAGVRRFADALVVESAWSARPFRSPKQMTIVPNGVDLDRFRPEDDKAGAKQRFGLPGSCPVIGMLARAHPTKGAGAFLELASRIRNARPNARFLLAGGPTFPGEVGAFADIARHASNLGEAVTLTGYLDDPRPAYGAMDVFLHLAQPEGLSMTLLEAWASGLPVVAYAWGAVGEAIEHGRTGVLVEPNDVPAVADAVLALINDADERARLGANGHAVCAERYSLAATSRALTTIIQRLAGR